MKNFGEGHDMKIRRLKEKDREKLLRYVSEEIEINQRRLSGERLCPKSGILPLYAGF